MRKAIGWVGAAIILCLLGTGIMAYIVSEVDPRTGVVRDGLGRELFPAPPLIRITQVQEWPGLWWWLADMVVFWTLAPLGLFLAAYGFSDESKKP